MGAPKPGDDEQTNGGIERPTTADDSFNASGSAGDDEERDEHELATRHLVLLADAAAAGVASFGESVGRSIVFVIGRITQENW
jgi:hypothetical protein